MKIKENINNELVYKYLFVILIIAVSLLIRIALFPADGKMVYSTFFPAVALIAMKYGHRMAIIGAIFGGMLSYLFLVAPFAELKYINLNSIIEIATYIFAAGIIAISFNGYFRERIENIYKKKNTQSKILLTVLFLGFAFLLHISFLKDDENNFYSIFYPAIALITLTCGFRFGLVSIFISSVLVYFFLLPPIYAFKIINLYQTNRLILFLGSSGIICFTLRAAITRGLKIKDLNESMQNLMATSVVGGNLEALIAAIASIIEIRDPYTAGHQRRVAELGVAIGQVMKLPERNLLAIKLAGLIHDLGKMKVPIEILQKPGKLSDLEYSLIKEHPQVAYEALQSVQSPWPLADIVLQHHERMDGSGYPNKLSGEKILIEARILAVADVVEAMSALRPYREALGISAALTEIRAGAGIKYDLAVVNACIDLFESEIFSWNKDQPSMELKTLLLGS